MQFALTPLDEHELLVFWTQLLVLVAAARFCGAVMRRLNLPSVIGQLGAGVILGPSIFGRVWTDGFEWFLPEHEISSGALFAVSWLGVAFLLVTAGFETDLGLIRRLGRAAALVTGFSLVVPLIGGLVVGGVLPESFIGSESDRTVFALFVAAALAVSALAVIAKILSELGLMRRDFGQITVAAGMANDVVGWIMLAVFTGFATSGEVSASGIVRTVGGLAIFLALAMTVGQRVVDRALRWVRRDGPDVAGAMTVVVMTMLIYGVATQALGIEAVLGAFVAGVVLHRSRFQQREVLDHLESVTNTFLAPVFFATAGLRVDLGLLGQDDAIAWAGVVVAVAIVAKFVGAFVGAKLAGQSNRAATALGAGLNARGALEIVIASVGLSLGVFTETAYTVIVIVPLITSIFAAVSLRIGVRDGRGTDTEHARLDREEALAKNLVVTSQRILLPSKGHPASIAAAQLAQFAWPKEAPSTILTVGDEDADISVLEAVLDEREVDHNRSSGVSIGSGRDVAASIVAESNLGYGVVVVGVAERHEGVLYSPMVDELLLNAVTPVVIVRRARGLDRPLPPAFSRAIVPVTGTPSSRSAQEVAFAISAQLGTEVLLTHVVNRVNQLPRIFARRGTAVDDPAIAAAESMMARAVERAHEAGISPREILREGASAGEALVDTARTEQADLVVLGAQLRNVDGRPFIGHTVEAVLERSDATVVVVAQPRPKDPSTGE
ncbi:MAG: cation:proton antiporter [Actinomycetota bacterium]|nr:cation:proton antiporter [Actinomycetota bacterium]